MARLRVELQYSDCEDLGDKTERPSSHHPRFLRKTRDRDQQGGEISPLRLDIGHKPVQAFPACDVQATPPRAVSRHGTAWGTGISENVVWYVVRSCARRLELGHLAPHDLRRTCAKLCHVNGGELEQIQFLLGHASVLTTERYLGCKQNWKNP